MAGFEHLRGREYVDAQRVGLAGFSVGASFALAAAADPRIADDIAFVNAFGGYYDAADLLAQIAAGRAVDGDTETAWEVDPAHASGVRQYAVAGTGFAGGAAAAGRRGQRGGGAGAVRAAARLLPG